jgi:hypothetical protein
VGVRAKVDGGRLRYERRRAKAISDRGRGCNLRQLIAFQHHRNVKERIAEPRKPPAHRVVTGSDALAGESVAALVARSNHSEVDV